MKGLIYKNVVQNRFQILITIAASLFLVIYTILIFIITESSSDGLALETINDSHVFRMFFTICTSYGIMLTHSVTISCDETKKWAYFAASSPKGVKGQVKSRYALIAMLIGIQAGIGLLIESVIYIVVKCNSDLKPSCNFKSVLITAFIVMLVDAVELPIFVRFGTKRGNSVHSVIFFCVLLAGLIYPLFGPLPDDIGNISEDLVEFIFELPNRGLPAWLKATVAALPFVSVIFYVISCKLSCRFYLAGVENYDK